MRHLIIGAVTAVIALSTVASQAASASGDASAPKPKPRGGGSSDGHTPLAIAVQDGTGTVVGTWRSRTRRASSGPSWTCRYYHLIPGRRDIGITGPDLTRELPVLEVGETYFLNCLDGDRYVWGSIVTWNPADPLGPVAAATRASEQALEALPLPEPAVRTAPPPGADVLVGSPVWLWVDTPWTGLAATATVSTISTTVTATPVELTFTPGDGSDPVTCTGPGAVWHPGASVDGACTHTFDHRSTAVHPGGTWPLGATITWEVSWEASDGTAGALDPITTEATVPVRVVELQAVITDQ